jgi:Uma2 family endonuclease
MSEFTGGQWEAGLAATETRQHPEHMSDQPPRRGATYEELAGLPSNVVGELVGGELYVSPRPALRHCLAASVLTAELIGPFGRGKGGPGGWVILAEPELHLGRDVLVPDVAGWRRERMPEVPETVSTPLAPDWVCEVLSPSTTVLDRGQKMKVYAAEGVKHVWLVDPTARMLEVYRLESGRWLLLGTHVASGVVRAEPFEALALELGALWAR